MKIIQFLGQNLINYNTMIRVKFSNNSDGSSAYTCAINPFSADLQDSYSQDYKEVLDGASIIQKQAVDTRPRRLIWNKFKKSHTAFQQQLGTLCRYLGSIKYVNFGSMDYRKHISTSWNKFRIADIIIKVQDASNTGAVKYDSVEVILLPTN